MISQLSSEMALSALASARQVADYAERLGLDFNVSVPRVTLDHVGALLADSILQAGLNYRTVVKVRVDRILKFFPETAQLSGVRNVVDSGRVSDFLLWNHPTKITRFLNLVSFLETVNVDDVSDLREWLRLGKSRERLMALNGVGPKTYDYICCLAGIDRIPIDRHIRTFASEAGVMDTSYDTLSVVVSYAADLLGMSRRDFDSWIWGVVSARACRQFKLV